MAKLRSVIESKAGYISPDDLYMEVLNDFESTSSAIAFFYFPDGKLMTGVDDTHYDIVGNNLEFFARLNNNRLHKDLSRDQWMKTVEQLRDASEKHSLVGRLAKRPRGYIVTFWNTNPEAYTYLDDCLKSLDQKYKMGDYIVSTPLHGTRSSRYLGDMLPKSKQVDTTLAKQLHTMGAGKKQAAKELGVGAGGKKKSIQKQYEELALLKPGQKYWALTSENRKRKSS